MYENQNAAKLDRVWQNCSATYDGMPGNGKPFWRMVFRCLDVAFGVVNNSTDVVNQKRLAKPLVIHIATEMVKLNTTKISVQDEVNFLIGIRNCTVWQGCLENYCTPW